MLFRSVVDLGPAADRSAYWLSRAVGRAGKVYVFETDEVLAEQLRSATRPAGNVVVEHLAVTRERFQSAASNPTSPPRGNVRHTQSDDCLAISFTKAVALRTLDQFFARRHADPVHLIHGTISRETFALLHGAHTLLAVKRPRIVLQAGAQHVHGDTEAVLKTLRDRGYDGYFFQPGGLEDLRRFDPELHQIAPDHPNYAAYFLFLPAAAAEVRRAA